MKFIETVLILLSVLKLNLVNSQCISFRNTIYESSGSNCGQRCIEKDLKHLTCDENIVSKGCFCKAGYFRDSSWNCVPGQDCFGRVLRAPQQPLSGGPGVKVRSVKSFSGDDTSAPKPQDCPSFEVYSDCGNYCTEKCRNTNNPYCPQNTCENGCFCIDGYFRTDEGDCVPQQKCGIKLVEIETNSTEVCAVNEHYEECARRCSETCGMSVKKCGGKKCEPGCFCDEGYGRNILGECVLRKECRNSGTCKKHEEFQLCGNSCAELCDPPAECTSKCTPGCYCQKGYLRNDRKVCVSDGSKIKTRFAQKLAERYEGRFKCQRTDEQKKIANYSSGDTECGDNEEKKTCGNRCGESCDSVGRDYVCPERKVCLKGCFCVKGFYRNAKDECVTADKCKKVGKASKELDKVRRRMRKQCKEDEAFKECGNHCVQLCIPPNFCPKDCEIGCFCKEGLFRNSYGECVPEKDCPPLPSPIGIQNFGGSAMQSLPTCGRNEKHFECLKDNCVQTCADLKDKPVCPTRKKCQFGCLCLKNHYRDPNGVCIPEKACASALAMLSTGLNSRGKKKKKRKKKTTVPDCGDHEEYLTCGNYCVELCKPPKKCPRACKAGCFCKTKYLRNGKGNCVKEKKCPKIWELIKIKIKDKCTKKHEILKCGTKCGESCKDQANFIQCPKNLGCKMGCFCKPGFYRNKKGHCVTIEKCVPRVGEWKPPKKKKKKKPKCGDNEVFDECGDHCIELCKPPDSCESQCESGCFCDTGFYRPKPDGPCIPEDECPKEGEVIKYKLKIKLKCEDLNEIYSECGTRCGQMCADLFKSVICPKKGLCVGGCFCKQGYFRNERGKCILQSQCQDPRPPPKKPLRCDKNEEYKECGDRCKGSCQHYLKKTSCPKENKCSAGCFCKQGFLKDMYGNCVEPKDCTDPTYSVTYTFVCDENEKFLSCGNRCGQTCEELVLNRTCSEMRSCVMGCFCEKGLRRDNNGLCIPEKDCYKLKNQFQPNVKCEENEEYNTCETRCGQACEDLGRKIDCPKERQCARGCFCKEGNFRNEKGDCVPDSECPDIGPPDQIPLKLDCGQNEEYNECGTRCGQACDDLSRKTTCPQRRICISGCFCKEGFFRTYSGECVPMLDCSEISPPKRPPPSCDANEEFDDCGKRCGQSCDDYKKKKRCPQRSVCVAGCFCDSDYRRDFKGECVPTNTCPARGDDDPDPADIKCGTNEEYSDCGTRCGQMCEELTTGSVCPKNRQCVSGCFCLEGYFRNDIGECVPQKECPPPATKQEPKKCGENEKWTECGSHCGESCEEVDAKTVCPRKRMCIAGCFCLKGYYRDKYDNCVTKSGCSSPKPSKFKPTAEPEDKSQPEDETDSPTEGEGAGKPKEHEEETTTEGSPPDNNPSEASDTSEPPPEEGQPSEANIEKRSTDEGQETTVPPNEGLTTGDPTEQSSEGETTPPESDVKTEGNTSSDDNPGNEETTSGE